MKHLGDITKINGAEVEPVDVITFGSPCQDMSVAGKREGMKHSEQGDEETTRSGLFYEAIRIIEEMRKATNGEYPKYAVWENVPGAFSSNKGRDFHAVLEALCSVCDDAVSIPEPYDKKRTKLVWDKSGEIVGDNYSVAWRTLDAQYWGVPQRRKRIYLVADFTGRRAGEILFKPDSLPRNLPQSDEAGQEAAVDALGGTDGGVGAVTPVLMDAYQHHGWRIGNTCGTLTTGQNNTIRGDSPLVIYSFDSLSSNSMKSANPKSGCRAVEIAKCIDTTYPDPSKNQGGIAIVTLNDQGGSSINVEQEEISLTLRANSHQHEPVIAMATQQGGAEIAENLCPTITAAAGMSGNNQPVIAFAQNQREEVRDLGGKAGALAAEAGAHQQTYVAQPVIALQANGIDRADTAGCNGCGWRENESYTLNTIDRHAVCYDARNHNAQDISGTIQAKSNGGQSLNYINPVCYDARGNGDGNLSPTITGDHQNRITDYTAVACFQNTGRGWWNESETAATVRTACGGDSVKANLVAEKKRRYIIRRLTPAECARLQGFPDWWGQLAPYDPADAEFWEDVRKTHAEINGKKYKPVKDIKKWYDKLHNDGAEYKMWGNGIALPNAEYVIRGIAEQGAKTLGSLFDGSGGFPLAGAMNGIKPLWASEVEPYPIAVTKSRFKEVGI